MWQQACWMQNKTQLLRGHKPAGLHKITQLDKINTTGNTKFKGNLQNL
jgi:hypothetical protein